LPRAEPHKDDRYRDTDITLPKSLYDRRDRLTRACSSPTATPLQRDSATRQGTSKAVSRPSAILRRTVRVSPPSITPMSSSCVIPITWSSSFSSKRASNLVGYASVTQCLRLEAGWAARADVNRVHTLANPYACRQGRASRCSNERPRSRWSGR
jgi:hypothetical protein